MTDYRDYIRARSVPVISHEIGQWCVYPNFAEMPAYTGPLKPRNFEIFRESLEAHGMVDQARDFLIASGKLQALCYKEEIESALRTPGMGGFELLALYDFPGQGTALVGVLDALWNPKGYITAGSSAASATAPCRWLGFPRRVFTTDEPLEAALEVAHFGPEPLGMSSARIKLVGDDGKTVASGRAGLADDPGRQRLRSAPCTIPLRDHAAAGPIQAGRGPGRNSLRKRLGRLGLSAAGGHSAPPDVTIVPRLDDEARAGPRAGGRVLLLVPPGRRAGDRLGKVGLGFSSIFWNTAWTRRQPPHTLGILCDPKHPALAGFPTESHATGSGGTSSPAPTR